MVKRIGVLALQGDFREHIGILRKLGAKVLEIRNKKQLEGLDGLVMPGGESTTIGKLIKKYGFIDAIKKRYKEGMGIFSTCAGGILLAKEIKNSKQPAIGLVDITIQRNAYGRQLDSFETKLFIKGFRNKFPAVFIRAPIIKEVHDGVEILAAYEEKPVLVKKKNILISTFHPELTDDKRIHKYFLDILN
ncbi:pyridoxal 5'-phosphate synthase glutaminase subunit PdxT [Candidatus Woesearchaeota archaeon]|nr:pyridoxal 5'-phosphate synthase glutaminase subunit PdxT [Candidatus Woesearchaeota archaeon]